MGDNIKNNDEKNNTSLFDDGVKIVPENIENKTLVQTTSMESNVDDDTDVDAHERNDSSQDGVEDAGHANIIEFEHVQASRRTNDDDTTEMVFTLPMSIGEDDMSDELIEELTNALSAFLDETDGNGKLAIDYIIDVTEGRTKIAKAQTVEELERAIVDNMVIPTARAASGMPNPNAAISILLTIDDKALLSELHSVCESGIVKEEIDTDAIDFDRMMDYFLSLCSAGIGDDGTDAALHDVWSYHTQKRKGTLPKIPKNKFGFFKKLKMARNVIKKQANMLRTMLKQAKSRRDIEIWYSRYLLAAPIEFAKQEGYPDSLARAAIMPPEAIKKECAQIAQTLGFDCSAWDIDYERVARGMRTFCVNKTGYSYPENWLYAAMSRWEADERKLG